MENLRQYILQNYKPEHGAKTQMWSEGNYDDVFADGEMRGIAQTLEEVAKLIGLEVSPLQEQYFD